MKNEFKELSTSDVESLEMMGITPDMIPEMVNPAEEEPKEEVMTIKEETSPEEEILSKFVFKLDESVEDQEEFELPAFYKKFKETLTKKDANGISNSIRMARQVPKIKIETIEEETGLPYGIFNGAGPVAITMYNPEHPDAPKSGRNYGKVFYRWGEERVMGVADAIYKEVILPQMNMKKE